MKFTSSQLNFLMSYLSVNQIEEIKSFSPQVPAKEKCSFIKKNGEACKNNRKYGENCPAHNRPILEKQIQEPCETIKENGDRCRFKVKKDGKCGLHLKKYIRQQIIENVVD